HACRSPICRNDGALYRRSVHRGTNGRNRHRSCFVCRLARPRYQNPRDLILIQLRYLDILFALEYARCRSNSMQFSTTTFGGLMFKRDFLRMILLVLTVSFFADTVHAQPASEFQPQVGQNGKDVIWVPTPQALVDKMLDMAKVTPKDYVIDLGSGDGRTVITAAKRGARALGIEYNPEMVELAKRNA